MKDFISPQCLVYEGEILNYHTLPCSPRGGGEFTPHIYNYIVLPQYPPHYPGITTRVSRASQKVSVRRLHRAGFDGFTSTPCEMQKKILFLSKNCYRLHIKVFVQSILLKKMN